MIAALRSHLQQLAKDSESGQAMVEFVIVFPMQIFLTLVIIQFAYIAHAHIVVSQAAFLGARSAAVSDMQGLTYDQAGRRAAARTCALLTSGGGGVSGVIPPKGELDWTNKDGRYGFDPARQREAYGLLTTKTRNDDGYVVCDVTFDYIMEIPIGNHLFAPFSDSPGAKGFTTFRVHRVGFVATPWAKQPVAASSSSSLGMPVPAGP